MVKDRFNITNIIDQLSNKQQKKNNSKPTSVSEHFLSNNHNVSDMLLIILVKSTHDSVCRATNQIKPGDRGFDSCQGQRFSLPHSISHFLPRLTPSGKFMGPLQ